MEVCPLCNFDKVEKFPQIGAAENISCPNCGNFEISYGVLSENGLLTNENKPIISYYIRNNQSNRAISLTYHKVKSILDSVHLPNPAEQYENIILFLGDNIKSISGKITLDGRTLIARIGSRNKEDIFYLVQQFNMDEYGSAYDTHNGMILYTFNLSLKGWGKYEELKKSSKYSKLAFMAMKFGNNELNNLFEGTIKNAIFKTGFEIRKLDEDKTAGLIDNKLQVNIHRSKFLVADLTHGNQGAYWEAGFATGLGIPVIYICKERVFNKRKTHFDTNHHLTITWENKPISLIKFADELKATIRATFPEEAIMED